jgi:hypothetical protein
MLQMYIQVNKISAAAPNSANFLNTGLRYAVAYMEVVRKQAVYNPKETDNESDVETPKSSGPARATDHANRVAAQPFEGGNCRNWEV